MKKSKAKGVPWIGGQPQVEDAGDEGNRCPVYKSSEATKGKEKNRHRHEENGAKSEEHEIDDLLEIMGASNLL